MRSFSHHFFHTGQLVFVDLDTVDFLAIDDLVHFADQIGVESDSQLLDLGGNSAHADVFMLLQLSDKTFSEVNNIGSTRWVLGLQQVIVDEVRLVQVLLKLVQLGLGCLCPVVRILKEPLWHSLHLSNLGLNEA